MKRKLLVAIPLLILVVIAAWIVRPKHEYIGEAYVSTRSPAGIRCGNTCTSAFTGGTVVTLTVRVIGNTVFRGWSGACSGTGTCTVTMNADKAVGATFDRR